MENWTFLWKCKASNSKAKPRMAKPQNWP